MSQVIITGDDLGLSAENNAGIIKAYREGVLTTASLMVGGDSLDEAISLVHQHHRLPIGLHVSLNDTRPVLPPEQVHLLVQTDGRFPPDRSLLRAAAYTRNGRRQIRAEIAAQFDAFQRIGIPCDHVNSHRNSQVHPIIALLIFQEAARRNVRATRIAWDATDFFTDSIRQTRATGLRKLAAYYGLRAPDRSVVRAWNIDDLIDYLATLRPGLTELSFHPVDTDDHMFAADLPLLLDPRVKAALNRQSSQPLSLARLLVTAAQ